ncbi:SIS domain-containing protein [Candidatus Poribacteria bacterium]
MGDLLFKTAKSVDEYIPQRLAVAARTKLTELVDSEDPGVEYTPGEIFQQPWTWWNTFQRVSAARDELSGFLTAAGLFDNDPLNRPNIIFSGAGTSDYVGKSVWSLLQKELQTEVKNIPSTDTTISPGHRLLQHQKYLMVHIARSGNSPESEATINYYLRAMPDNVKHIVITCNAEGVLAHYGREHPDKCFTLVLDESTDDEGLAMTSSCTSMEIASLALAHINDMGNYQRIVTQLCTAGEYLLDKHADRLYSIVEKKPIERGFYLGTDNHEGTATECALKMQELTQGRLITKPETFLAFRHGPISAVNEHSVVVYFLDSDSFKRAYEIDVVEKVANECQPAESVIVCDRSPDELKGLGLVSLEFDPDGRLSIPDEYRAPLYTIVGQMLGLFASVNLGMSPDKPSGDEGSAAYTRVVKPFNVLDAIAYQESGGLVPLKRRSGS